MRNKKILVVDDDENDFLLVQECFRRVPENNLEVHWISNYQEALAELPKNRYDLYLLDYQLGAQTGLRLLEKALAAGCNRPIVMLTGSGNRQIDLEAMKKGAMDYVKKGDYSPETLERTIRYAITLKEIQERLRTSEERYALAVEGAVDGIWDWDFISKKIFYSDRLCAMLGFEKARDFGSGPDSWFSRVHPSDLSQMKLNLDTHLGDLSPFFESEFRMRHEDGKYIWIFCRGKASVNAEGVVTRISGSFSDITKMKYVDGLTQLPSQVLFEDRLNHEIRLSTEQGGSEFAVLLVDVDRFKQVNDAFGSEGGDRLLKISGRKIAERTGNHYLVARVQMDRFAILMPFISGPDEVADMTEGIFEIFKTPFYFGDHPYYVSASIGIVYSKGDYTDAKLVLRDCETALQRAKSAGGNRHEVFDPSMHSKLVAYLQEHSNLKEALKNREFEIHFQPILPAGSSFMSGAEALLRWRRPGMGLVPPADFIPLAEETGLIVPLGKWVFQESCSLMARWNQGLKDKISIAVNFSFKQFQEKDLIDWVAHVLKETSIHPEWVKVEITESMVMGDVGWTLARLHELKNLGIKLSMDDFGTGYSSLSYLRKLPLDYLKIDKSFVKDIGPGESDNAIVNAILGMAKSLGLACVAEGVESPMQHEFLKNSGCGEVQGYLFHRPLPAPDFEKLLERIHA